MPGVQQETFRHIVQWLENPSNDAAISDACGHYLRRKANALAIIRAIAAYNPWPGDGIIDLMVICALMEQIGEEEPGKQRQSRRLGPLTLNGHAVVVREIIRAACRDMSLPRNIHVESRVKEKIYQLSWTEADNRHSDHIYLLTTQWRDEYIDDMIRGFFAMGESLGIIPEIIRVAVWRDIPKAVLSLINTHRGRHVSLAMMPLAVPGDVREWLDGEIELIDLKKRGFEQLLEHYKMTMPITTVGFDKSYVKQDNYKIGALLGERAIADARENGRESGTVVVIGTDKVGTGDPFVNRRRHFMQHIRHGGDDFVVKETAYITCNELFSLVSARKAEQALVQFLEDDRNDRKIFAVYVHTTTMMDGVLNALRMFQRSGDVKVYVDYLSSTVLKLLADQDSPITAAICVDPFHYGRLVFRVAASRTAPREQDLCDTVPPTLITKKEVMESTIARPHSTGCPGICYMAELPFLFPERDICLEDRAKYAWKDWMEKRLENSFGPTLRERRRRFS
jgi:hypothetical protein